MTLGAGIAVMAIWLSAPLVLWVLKDRRDLVTWDNLLIAGGAYLLAMWASTCAVTGGGGVYLKMKEAQAEGAECCETTAYGTIQHKECPKNDPYLHPCAPGEKDTFMQGWAYVGTPSDDGLSIPAACLPGRLLSILEEVKEFVDLPELAERDVYPENGVGLSINIPQHVPSRQQELRDEAQQKEAEAARLDRQGKGGGGLEKALGKCREGK